MARTNITAVITAEDRASKILKDFGDHTAKLASRFSSAMKLMGGAAVAAISVGITKNIGNAIKRIDTLDNSLRTFENMGFKVKDSREAVNSLNKSILGLPTALDDAIRGTTLLASATGDIKKGQKIYSALNDAILGFGGNTEMVQNAVLQLSQDLSGGVITGQTWISMLNSGLGPALKAVAKTMGLTTQELKDGLSKGKISAEQFTDVLIEMDKKGGGGLKSFQKLAQDSTKGIGSSLSNMNTSIVRGLAKLIKAIGSEKIANAIKGIGDTFESAMGKLSDEISKPSGIIKKFKSAIKGDNWKSIGEDIGKTVGDAITFSTQQIVRWFGKIEWAEIGFNIGKQGINFAVGFVSGLITADWWGAFKVLADHWLEILIGILAIVFTPGKLATPIKNAISKIPFVGTLTTNFLGGIRSVGTPLREAFGTIFDGAITGGLGRIKAGLSLLKDIILAPFRIAIENARQIILQLPSGVQQMVQRVGITLNPIYSIFGKIFDGAWNLVVRIFSPVGEFFRGVVGRIVGAFSGIGGRIKSFFSGIWQGVANNLKDAINRVLRLPLTIPTITVAGKKIGGQTIIPRLAQGTTFAQGGATLVGERGPEIVNIPRGARVVPNNQISREMGGGNISINVNVGMYAGSEIEKRRVAESILEALKDVAGSRNMSLGKMLGI